MGNSGVLVFSFSVPLQAHMRTHTLCKQRKHLENLGLSSVFSTGEKGMSQQQWAQENMNCFLFVGMSLLTLLHRGFVTFILMHCKPPSEGPVFFCHDSFFILSFIQFKLVQRIVPTQQINVVFIEWFHVLMTVVSPFIYLFSNVYFSFNLKFNKCR